VSPAIARRIRIKAESHWIVLACAASLEARIASGDCPTGKRWAVNVLGYGGRQKWTTSP
jgi:hypothetical protein